MASVNKVILLGRLGRDPEVRYTPDNNMAISRLAVATSRMYKDRDGNRKEETEWHNVSVFGRQAEIANQYLKKGSEVYIEGRLRTRKYTGKDGIERYSTEVVCESLQLGARPAGQAPAQPRQESASAAFESPERPAAPAAAPASAPAGGISDDDIPF